MTPFPSFYVSRGSANRGKARGTDDRWFQSIYSGLARAVSHAYGTYVHAYGRCLGMRTLSKSSWKFLWITYHPFRDFARLIPTAIPIKRFFPALLLVALYFAFRFFVSFNWSDTHRRNKVSSITDNTTDICGRRLISNPTYMCICVLSVVLYDGYVNLS